MTSKKHLDIVQALSSKKAGLLIGTGPKSKLFRKMFILEALLSRQASFHEVLKDAYGMIWGRLPIGLRKPEISEKWASDLMGKIVFRRIFGEYPLDTVDLLGYRLSYLPSQELLSIREKYLYFSAMASLIEQIIILDQYCAREFIKDHFTIIDAGANMGIFSFFAHQLAPNGMVYAFEPYSRTCNLFKKFINENGLSEGIQIFQNALGDKSGLTKLMVAGESAIGEGNMIADSVFFKGREGYYPNSETVSMITIDDFVIEHSIPRVDFIKIDTEGYEKQIIMGAQHTIKKFLPVIACSAYHLKDDKIEIPKLVTSINSKYQYRLEKRAEEVLIFWVDTSQ